MAEYIDRDALLAEAKRISGPMTGDGWDNWGVYALINRQPAADVVERKRGKWIPDEWDTDDDRECICSCCREQGLAKQGRWDVYLSNFCPHCGAEMSQT